MTDLLIMGIWWWWALIGLATAALAIVWMWRSSWKHVLDAIDQRHPLLPPTMMIFLLALSSVVIFFFSIPTGPILTALMIVIWAGSAVVANRRAHLARRRNGNVYRIEGV